MDQAKATEIVRALYSDVAPLDVSKMPLLAHYTSMDTLEKIMKSDEIWFSHPLLMNDHEEVHWGLSRGAAELENSAMLHISLNESDRYSIFVEAFRLEIKNYWEQHVFDTYLLCLSAHDASDADGLLSMWRGYGGNGTGAAIVFDPKQLVQIPTSPLVLDQVQYKSNGEREAWAKTFVALTNALVQQYSFSDDELPAFAKLIFERLKVAAIFSKHKGFSEEQEWRLVYMPERDTARTWRQFFDYMNGSRGLEPKLKFKIRPIDGVTAPDLSLEKIVSRIILGPNRASLLVEGSTRRMLQKSGKEALVPRLVSSGIPYRAFS